MIDSRRAIASLLLGAILLMPLRGFAADYPDRPITILVGYPAGSPPDVVTRIVADKFAALTGQPAVVVNKPGASGTIALRDLVNGRADGYTLMALASPTISVLSLYPNVTADPAKDLAPVVQIEWDYNVLVTGKALAVNSMKDLIALLKSKPGKMSNASGGIGTPAHIVGELMKIETGTSAVHVPYAQFMQTIGDLATGRIDFMVMGAAVAVPQVQSGQLRALAVTSPARLAGLPTVPTFGEEGFAGAAARGWIALVAKGGTPPDIVARLNRAVNDSLVLPEVRSGLERLQSQPAGGTPQELAKLLASEAVLWKRVIQDAKITLE